MILSVSFDSTTFNEIPYKFEAGTPPIAQAIGLGSAITYLENVGIDNVNKHEKYLLDYATVELESIPGLRIIGKAENKAGVISFVLDKVHPHDIGTILNDEGVAIRTGRCRGAASPGVGATPGGYFGLFGDASDL